MENVTADFGRVKTPKISKEGKVSVINLDNPGQGKEKWIQEVQWHRSIRLKDLEYL